MHERISAANRSLAWWYVLCYLGRVRAENPDVLRVSVSRAMNRVLFDEALQQFSVNSSGLGAHFPSLPADCGGMWMSENSPVIAVIVCADCRAGLMRFLCEWFRVCPHASSHSFAYNHNLYCDSKQCSSTL